MIRETVTVTGRSHMTVDLDASMIDDLRARLDGPVMLPGDDGWDGAVTIWNAMAASTPAVVVQPQTALDVSEVVRFARDNDLLLSVKGGGHNIAGTALAPGCITLDMSRMRDVTVRPDERRVDAGAGCLLQHVDHATQQHGLATVLGIMSEVGIAGLTLGGGFGYLARRFGWAVDNLDEVEIVTADGEVRVASREREPELFWAVRGGGGNLGVVTRFTYRLHDVGPTVTGGLIAWSAERAGDVLAAYRDVVERAPRELTAAIVMRLAPPAPFVPEAWRLAPVIAMVVCHSGPNPAADLAPIRAIGDPVVDLVGEHPYVEQQSLLDEMDPKGFCQYWKTEYLDHLSAEYCDTFARCASRLTSPMSYSVIFHIGGALNERASDDGAVGNRDARFVTGFSAVWPPDQPATAHVRWARESWHAIRPFSTGGNYVNFQLADDNEDRLAAAYGGNLDRLRRVKARYDPHNLFRVNRNITPSA